MKFNVNYKIKEPVVIKSADVGKHKYTLTSEYLLKDGKPYIYTMGELHFSRMLRRDWERELKKMKAGGIDIVSSYLFWNHHEKEEGKFDFSDNRNLCEFVDCCEALGIPFYLRIGPWVHGELRLGGFPDWIESACNKIRSDDEKYLFYVRRFYEKVYEQIKTSKNIIGLQIENEYCEKDRHLETLKTILEDIGFDTVITSITGWGGPVVPDGVVPMWGSYPESPWEDHINIVKKGQHYGFYTHPAIAFYREEHGENTELPYPIFTCELGGGNQNTYQRRPLIQPWEVAALTLMHLATGCNGIGYYMYHGGTNPVIEENGKIIHSFQESRATNYSTDCPMISYDFQSPLGDNGQIRQSYYDIQKIMAFIKTEEQSLASMMPYQAEILPEYEDFGPLRAGVRSNGNQGYIFFMNTCHGQKLEYKEDTAEICLENETLKIPMAVPENSYGVIPFNYTVGTQTLKWIKAMPVCRTEATVYFSPLDGIPPEYMLSDSTVGNFENTDKIGGIKVELVKTLHPVADKSRPLTVSKDESRLPFDVFAHIMPRNAEQKLTEFTAEYTADIPENTSYISILAKGNLGAVYEEKSDGKFRLITDKYLDGDVWIADVRDVKKVIIKIQPFVDGDEKCVYLETPFETGHFTPKVYAHGENVFVETPKGIFSH